MGTTGTAGGEGPPGGADADVVVTDEGGSMQETREIDGQKLRGKPVPSCHMTRPGACGFFDDMPNVSTKEQIVE